MSENENLQQHDQRRPETGIDQDPSKNTAPPSNPPVEEDALEAGKEKLGRIVNW